MTRNDITLQDLNIVAMELHLNRKAKPWAFYINTNLFSDLFGHVLDTWEVISMGLLIGPTPYKQPAHLNGKKEWVYPIPYNMLFWTEEEGDIFCYRYIKWYIK